MSTKRPRTEDEQAFDHFMKVSHDADRLKEAGVKMEDALIQLKIDNPKDFRYVQSMYIGNGQLHGFPKVRLSKTGVPSLEFNHPANMNHLIKKYVGKLTLNLLKNQIYLNGAPINDFDLSNVRNLAREFGLSDAKDFANDSISIMAKEKSFHPFKTPVESKAWDGQDHIEALFQTLTINKEFASNTELYRKFLRRWLIGMVAKVYKPGSQNGVLTLQSGQGIGKSKWFQMLSLDEGMYGEGQLNPDSKDDVLKHLDYVLWHASELEGIVRKRDVSALKDFFTKSDVATRPAYGRFERVGKSVCSFCASVNDATFLNDPTGSRRYYVIPVESINYQHNVDLQQVFAQALSLFRAGEQWWFAGEEIQAINDSNESFTIQNAVDGLAANVVAGEEELTAPEIFANHDWPNQPSHAELGKFGVLLRKKGIEAKRISRNGIKLTVYKVKRLPRGN